MSKEGEPNEKEDQETCDRPFSSCLFFAAAFPPFVFAETPNAPAVMEMQETYDVLPSCYNAMEEGLVTGIKKQTGQNFFCFEETRSTHSCHHIITEKEWFCYS